MPNIAPTLTGVSGSVTFGENLVNATPQVIDTDVSFLDPDNNYTGGTLRISGLLAEDRIGLFNQGIGIGQIGVSGSSITYSNITIGSFSGGVGNAFTVTFNANATASGIDALIQQLTYADVSNTPTAARTLIMNVFDAAGGDIEGAPSLTQLTGVNNPFSTFSTTQSYILPTGLDFDNDGDIDLAVGTDDGTLLAFRNNGNGTFTQLTGVANPFTGLDVGSFSSPAAGDVDNDGDLDLVIGADTHALRTLRNNGNGTFTEMAGVLNPFNGLNFNTISQPSSGDFDGDGDSDFIVTEATSTIHSFRNNGDGTFTELTGGANPFAAFVGQSVGSTFVDIDFDGDVDVVMGRANGTLVYGRNNGNGTFTQLTGAANPFNGIDTGNYSSPVFVDVDGDSDLDMISGSSTRVLTTWRNNAAHGVSIIVNVTAEAENSAPTLNHNSALTLNEGATGTITAALLDYDDAEQADSAITYTITSVATNGTLKLSGAALGLGGTFTQDDINNNRVTYAHDGGETTSGAFGFSVGDGVGISVTGQSFVFTITPVNDVPTIGGAAAGGVTEDVSTPNLSTTGALTLSDADAGESSFAIQASTAGSNGYGTFTLAADGSWTYAAANGQSAVQQLGAGDTLTDSFTALSSDGTSQIVTVTIAGTNDAPVVDLSTGTGGIDDSNLYVEGGDSSGIGTSIAISDADAGDMIHGATIAIYDPDAGDLLSANLPLPGGITIDAVNSTDSILVLIGTASAADYATALGQVGFNSTSDDPTLGATHNSRTIGVTVNDGTIDSDPAMMTISVLAVDDAPVAHNDAVATDEATLLNGNVLSNNGSGPDVDVDGPPPSVSAVNGSPAYVGTQITLASGARLILNADGTFAYDPNHAFDAMPAAGSGASNTPAHDSFTYTLTGGNTATVTVTVTGVDSNDLLIGTAGADTLDGGTGNDILRGLGGDDVYYVDTVGDNVREAIGGGNDRIYASADYTLRAGQEIEILSTSDFTGSAALALGGNEFDNLIIGNGGANILYGKGGNDILRGLGGNDVYYVDTIGDNVREAIGGGNDRVYASADYTLRTGQEIEVLSTDWNDGTANLALGGNELNNSIYGNAGNNILDGKGGYDILIGLGGNDSYYVDSVGDNVVEAVGGGNDRIYASADYTLRTGSEIEVLSTSDFTDTTALALGGNGFANLIIGNAGANILDGKGGYDTLIGLGGDDNYYVDTVGDTVGEAIGGGNDRVYASADYTLRAGQEIEVLSTDWNDGTTNLALGGNELDNSIYGNNGNNILYGKGGNDTLLGLGGADQFWFLDAPAAGNVDTILDFQAGVDEIVLLQGQFGNMPAGTLGANAFQAGNGIAQDADDRILYDTTTGALYFDADGNGIGAAVHFATLTGAPAITVNDFTVL